MTDEKLVSAQQLSKHSTEDDCWLTIHGKVYDVTKYLLEHPGGLDVMMEHAGKDATEEFEYYGHSDKARQQMAEFLIGSFEGGDPAPVKEDTAATKGTAVASAPPNKLVKVLQALMPLLLIVAAFVIKTYVDQAGASA